MEALADILASTTLSPRPDSPPPVCVPFNPTGANADSIKAKLENTPRYLFRVYDEDTSGETSKECVKSLDAVEGEANHMVDAFSRTGAYARGRVARELNEHVRWWTTTSGKNNFHSWTNSLPFAIHYAIYRTKHMARPLDQIFLCVIDTVQLENSGLRHGVFIKDMDLMSAYSDALHPDEEIEEIVKHVHKATRKWDSGKYKDRRGLPNLVWFRGKRGRETGFPDLEAYNYFGEYLSQGKLEIGKASTTISFDKIINDTLYRIEPRFMTEMVLAEESWARATMELREPFYNLESRRPTTQVEIEAVVLIAEKFESPWRLAIAANLFAMRPRVDDQVLLDAFHNNFKETEEVNCSQLQLRGTADYRLPEVVEFHKLAANVIRDRDRRR